MTTRVERGPAPLAGFGTVLRLVLRRDRALLVTWLIAMSALVIGMVTSVRIGYPTPEAMSAFAASATANPSELALRGPIYQASVGGLLAWTLASSGSLVNGVVGILLAVRNTRTEEHSGRSEMLRSVPVGRLTLPAAAVAAPGLTALTMGLVAFLGLFAQGLPAAGSATLAGILAGNAILFVAVGTLAGQLTESPGPARALGFIVLGVVFAAAAVGDLAGSPVVWVSPFGWARHAAAFAYDRGWVLLLPVAATVVVLALVVLGAWRRDLGGALVRPRPAPAQAARWFASPLAVAWRRQRGALAGWAVGLGALGLLMGSVTGSLSAQLDTPTFRQFAQRIAGDLSVGRAFFLFILYVLAQVATAAALAAVLQLRTDETSGLAETLLATPVGRPCWLVAQMVVAVAVGGGVIAGIGFGAALSSGDWVVFVLGLGYLPAVVLMVGLAAALVGWVPRAAVSASWAVLALLLFLDLLGEFGLVPATTMNVSPFALLFNGLVGTGSWPVAALGLAAAGVVLGWLGAVGIRRRDLRP
ncbi:hypothetical protein [Raineyella sp. W15-4]|uniref:hypothetical protein n=1 Tax=Raineyella sp. W15-4 TaxID=3081651 RepID=UPI00295522F2|nr:hypothetical protein [Raineyella sp. W15-4]WOQ18058.1 hypothetical protein R0145_04950 [Raineyella sp. W15-4]